MDQKLLRDGIDINKNFAKEFKQRAEKKKVSVEEEKQKCTKAIQKEKVCINKYTDTHYIP